MTDSRGQTTYYTYGPATADRPGQLTSIVDANSHTVVTNHYNSEGRIDWQEDALGYRTTYSYSDDSFTSERTTIITDALGQVTIDTYDEDGLLIRQEDDDGFYETYAYDENYSLNQLSDKNGHVTLYEWNECGCSLTLTVDPMGYTTYMTYDERNQLTSVVDERGYTTTLTYDAFTNPTQITNPERRRSPDL